MASRSLGTLTLDLIARTGKFTSGFSNAERTVDKSTKRMTGLLSELKKEIGRVSVIGAFVGALYKMAQQTIEAENAVRQLEARLKSTSGVAGVSSRELQALAGELQGITTFADDAILGMQGVLLTFTNIRGETFSEATRAILDLSVAMGQDLQSSAVQVGKALNDPIKGITALQRIGVAFSATQKQLIKDFVEVGDIASAQRIILKELRTEFGGAATAAANTLGGSLTQLRNAFDDLFEVKTGVGTLTASIRELTKLLQDPETATAFQTLSGLIVKGITNIVDTIVVLGKAVNWFIENKDKMFLFPQVEWVLREFQLVGSELENIRDEIEYLEEQRDTIPWILTWKGEVKNLDDIIEKLKELRREEARLVHEQTGPIGPPRRLGPAKLRAQPGDLEAIEEIEKVRDGLLQQIATFDQAAAAVMRYRIEQGDLAEAFKKARKEGEPLKDQLIALAAAAESTQLKKQIQDQTDQLRTQAAVLGLNAEQTMRYRIEQGDLAETFKRMGAAGRAAAEALIQQAKATEEAESKFSVREMTRDIRDQAAVLGLNAEQTMRYRITVGDLAETFQRMGEAGRYAAAVLLAETSKAEKAINDFELKGMTEDLRDQIATFGQGAAQVMRYRLVVGDLKDTYDNTSDAGKAFADEVVNLTLQMQLLEEATKSVDDTINEMSESLNESLDKFMADFEKRFLEKRDVLLEFMEGLAQGTENIISDALINGFEGGAKGVLKSFGELMTQLIAQAVAADLAKRMFGEVAGGTGGGWIGWLATAVGIGAKASGGPVRAGMPYLVGERGPELIVPSSNATVIPAGRFGAQNNYITLTVETPTGRVPMETQQQLGNRLLRSLAEARRRNG